MFTGVGIGTTQSPRKYNNSFSNYSTKFVTSGSEQTINFGDNLDLGDGSFAISVWVRRDDKDTKYGIISKNVDGDTGWYIATSASDEVYFRANVSRAIKISYKTDTSALDDNGRWQHIVVNIDTTSDANSGIWTNGSSATLVTETETGIGDNLDNSADLLFGKGPTLSATDVQNLSGSLDEIAFFNVSIHDKIADLRTGTSGGGNAVPADIKGMTGLRAYYRMGEGINMKALTSNMFDEVGSVDGTMNNMPTLTTIVSDTPNIYE